jgi:2-keto-4-pentenoate hydratase/2-oxohepta-3-ene-1,7-dioic acid hydratase in catechol pathway
MIMNDWSARDLQSAEMRVGLGPAKGKDFATTLGPWIVTVDELAGQLDSDGFLDVKASVTVNGVHTGGDRLSHMGWGFNSLVAYASRDSWVRPGDVLGSGTTGGGGCLAELWGRRGKQDPPPLRDGDIVEITVEALGSIRNVVATAPPAPGLPAVRRKNRSI